MSHRHRYVCYCKFTFFISYLQFQFGIMYGFLSEQAAEKRPAFEGVGSGEEGEEDSSDVVEDGYKLRVAAAHQQDTRHYDKDSDSKQNGRRSFALDRDFTVVLEPRFVLGAMHGYGCRKYNPDGLVDGPERDIVGEELMVYFVVKHKSGDDGSRGTYHRHYVCCFFIHLMMFRDDVPKDTKILKIWGKSV